MRVLAADLVARGEFVNVLADEVAEAIFSGPMRDKLRLSLTSIIGTRLAQHGEAVAALTKIRRELSEDWRVKQGGDLGAPTDTRDLVGMAMQMHAEVSKGEELILKAVKLAIDERKGINEASAVRGGLAPYTGAAEVIPIPAELSPGEREDIRHLLNELVASVRSKDVTADVRVLASPESPLADSRQGEFADSRQGEFADSRQASEPSEPTTPPVPPPSPPPSSESTSTYDPFAM